MFNENALRIGANKFSYSKLYTGKACPYKYTKRYLEKSPPSNKVDSAPAQIGIAVHAVFETAMNYIVAQKLELQNLESILDASFSMVVAKYSMTTYEFDMVYGMRNSVRNKLTRLTNFAKKTGCHVFVESGLAIKSDFSSTDFRDPTAFFNGKLDLVLVKDTGEVAIVDHKTGKRKEGSYDDQLKIYEVLTYYALAPQLQNSLGIKIKSIKSGLNYINDDGFIWYPETPAELVETKTKEYFINLVNTVSDKITENSPSKGDQCKYCPYKTSCWSVHGWGRKRKATVEKETVIEI